MKRVAVVSGIIFGFFILFGTLAKANSVADGKKGVLVVKAKMEKEKAEEIKKALLEIKGVQEVTYNEENVEIIFDAKTVGCCKKLTQVLKNQEIEFEVVKVDNPACKGKCCTGSKASCEKGKEHEGKAHKCHHSH